MPCVWMGYWGLGWEWGGSRLRQLCKDHLRAPACDGLGGRSLGSERSWAARFTGRCQPLFTCTGADPKRPTLPTKSTLINPPAGPAGATSWGSCCSTTTGCR